MRAVAATLPRLALRAPRVALVVPPRWRLRLFLAATLLAALGTLYLVWFRDSSFVSVQRVQVSGLDTPDGTRIRAELTTAAHRMTTLHPDPGILRAAVRDEPLVRDVAVSGKFPHTLRVHVVENRPVAELSASAGSRSLAVAPDGTLLPGARAGHALPVIRLRLLPDGGARRVESPSVRRLTDVAGAAPAPLLARASSVSRQPAHGIVVQLRNGPAIWFGGVSDLSAKWRAAAAVLAQRSSRGAAYLDVRMPQRPVAGGFAGVGDAGSGQLIPQASSGSGGIAGAPPAIPADPGSAPTPPGIPATPGSSQPSAQAPAAISSNPRP